MSLEVSWDSLLTLSFRLSQFHGHGSWLVCEVALSFALTNFLTSLLGTFRAAVGSPVHWKSVDERGGASGEPVGSKPAVQQCSSRSHEMPHIGKAWQHLPSSLSDMELGGGRASCQVSMAGLMCSDDVWEEPAARCR